MIPPEIMDYYRRGSERYRLIAGPGRLEYMRTWDILHRTLPAPPAVVVDVGGATGVYAAPLARKGYQVYVVEPVLEYVVEAAARRGVTAVIGDARTLPLADRSADVVLLLGPLYHLLERDDRVTAWREAARVLRPDGVVVAATISRFASMLNGFVKDYYADPRFIPIVERALASGLHRKDDDAPGWFTSAYLHHPDEIPAEVADGGLYLHRLVPVEGPLWLNSPGAVRFLVDVARTKLLLDMLRKVEDEPSLLGASEHLLVIGGHTPRVT